MIDATGYRISPVAVLNVTSFVAVTAGRSHSCGVTADGTGYCWGGHEAGQLGIGPPPPVALATAQKIPDLTFARIIAGAAHSCGLTPQGAAYCWGDNFGCKLGNGTCTGTANTPVAVSGGLRFQQLTVAAVHVCGVTITGDAYCWGGGGNGRLGSGGTADSPVPVAVTGGLKFLAVAAGDAHTCGVTPLGAMYCWGRNNKGQLGIGNTTDSLTPALVIDPP